MDLELLLEAERRGILPPDKAELLAEARRRGLVPGGEAKQDTAAAEAQMKALVEQAQAAYAAGDDAEGKRLLTEASRLSVDSGMAPEGMTADPRTGGMIDLRRDPSLDMGAGKSTAFGAMQGLGFNTGDEAIGALAGGMNALGLGGGIDARFATEQAREMERRAQEGNPVAYYGGLIPGAVASSLSMAKGLGLAKAPATVPGAMAQGATLGGIEGALAGAGGAEGGLQERGTAALWNGLLGAGVGGTVAPLVGAGIQKVADTRAANLAIREAAKNAPTTEALRAEGQAAYKAIDDAGVQIRPDRVRAAMGSIAEGLRSQGAGYTGAEKVMPASRSIMEATSDVGAQANSVPFKELDIFRRYMGTAARANPANQGDTRAATEAMGTLDDFIRNLSPDDVDAGDVATLQEMLPKARDLWTRMSRSQTIDDAMEASEDYLSGSASGIRNQFARILRSPALSRGFSDAEKTAMRKVINGSIPQQALNLLGGGMGQLATLGAGFGIGGLPGAAVGMAAGAGFRKGSEAVARRNAEVVRALIANGGLETLPVASPGARKVAEALTRRTVTAPQ